MKLPVHRIIPFSNVEGVGNRTSVFVQGCNANCLYCHNSETIPMTHEDAYPYTISELMEQIKYNMPFIRGITVSGGEATLYWRYVKDLFDEAHALGLTCYIDTNGFFDMEKIKDLIHVTDKFLYDVKGIGAQMRELCFSDFMIDGAPHKGSHRFVVENKHLENLAYLLSVDKVEEVRLVYLKGFYDEEIIIETIASLLKEYPTVPLKIIRVHTRGLPEERAKILKGRVPSRREVEKLVELARSKKIKKIEYIL